MIDSALQVSREEKRIASLTFESIGSASGISVRESVDNRRFWAEEEEYGGEIVVNATVSLGRVCKYCLGIGLETS